MNELVFMHEKEAMTTSLLVAEKFHKRHDNVMQKIEKLIAEDENSKSRFHKSWYKTDGNRKSYPFYYMDRDGFVFLVMGFTGKEANIWKWKYIDAFNLMEKELRNRKISAINQKASMKTLHDNLPQPSKRDYIKACTISSKAISNIFGYPKSIKKADMTSEMLEKYDNVCKDTVELMAMKEKYNLDIHVSEKIYEKYC